VYSIGGFGIFALLGGFGIGIFLPVGFGAGDGDFGGFCVKTGSGPLMPPYIETLGTPPRGTGGGVLMPGTVLGPV